MYRHVLVPTDGSKHAVRTAEFARDLLKLNPSAKATVLYVRHVNREYHVYRWAEVEHPLSREALAKIEAAEAEILAQSRAVFEAAGLTVAVESRVGDPVSEILSMAENKGADLIVMGSLGASQIAGLLLGSTCERVLHLAKCPVIVVK